MNATPWATTHGTNIPDNMNDPCPPPNALPSAYGTPKSSIGFHHDDIYVRDLSSTSSSTRRVFSWITLCLFLLCLGFFWPMVGDSLWPHIFTKTTWSSLSSASRSYHQSTRLRIQSKCENVVESETFQFQFNITKEVHSTKEWKLHAMPIPAHRAEIKGNIVIERGNVFQVSDIDVRIVALSNTSSAIEHLNLFQNSSFLEVESNTEDRTGGCVEVQIMIFLRPWPRPKLDLLEIQSDVLDVSFEPSLNWELDNLIVHTAHGDSSMEQRPYVDPLIAHNVSVSSKSGEIFGFYLPNPHLTLRNERGPIGVFLCAPIEIDKPLRDPSIPFDPKSISISTISGDIGADAVFEVWPAKVYTHRIAITTVSGNVLTQVAHGSYTNITTTSGNVSSYIRTYGTDGPDVSTELYTTSHSGSLRVYLSDIDAKSVGKYNPLSNLTSVHQTKKGTLDLKYPWEWQGIMEGKIKEGVLDFDGSRLENVERGEGFVKVQRGREGNSHMEALVGTGELDIRLGMD